MTRALRVGFANLGRADHADQVREALRVIHDEMDRANRAALFLNEIDEGDRTSPSDHELLNDYFRRWEDHAWDSREPIMTKELEVKRCRSRRAARGVAHQSPARQLHEAVIDGGEHPDIVLIGGHYPAGARNGQRPALVKVRLVGEYVRMQALHAARVRHHHRAGRHVIWAMDVNWRRYPRLHWSEGTLMSRGPDLIRVIPAKGWTAHRGRHSTVALPIEPLHRLLWSDVTFQPVKPTAE